MLSKIAAHTRRISYQLGRRVRFGSERFKMRGYFANRLNHTDLHEPFLGALLRKQLDARSGVVIDVGVNVGQTLTKVLSIDRNREYLGFEPQVGCCYFVDQFLRLNGLRNASVLPIALSDSNHTLTLYSSGEFDEMASVADQRDVTGVLRAETTHVQARIGDEVLRELSVREIAVIKVDVEGAELQVFRGLRDTLRTKRPPLIFEVLPNFYGHERVMQPPDVRARNQELADDIYELLDDIGYDICHVNDQGVESKIHRFELNDRQSFAGYNYIAHHRSAD